MRKKPTKAQLLDALTKVQIDLDCIRYHAVGSKWRGIPSLCSAAIGYLNEVKRGERNP